MRRPQVAPRHADQVRHECPPQRAISSSALMMDIEVTIDGCQRHCVSFNIKTNHNGREDEFEAYRILELPCFDRPGA
jgi:hypothetical protein